MISKPMWSNVPVAFKIAYDGKMFTGSARQPDHRTVEGTLIKGLMSLGALKDADENTFHSASRTDRGVSALGNVFVFETSMKGDDVCKAMNGTYSQEGVWFMGWAKVKEDFRPRHAKMRWYRYTLPVPAHESFDITALKTAAKAFVGSHEFSAFCKYDKSLSIPRTTIRVLKSIDVQLMALALGPVEELERGRWTGHEAIHPGRVDLIIVDMKGQSFLWQMVRRVTAAMMSVARGRSTMDEIVAALDGKKKEFGVLPPEGLTLMDVEYPFDFTPVEGTKGLREGLETEVLWDLARDMVFHQHLQKKLLR